MARCLRAMPQLGSQSVCHACSRSVRHRAAELPGVQQQHPLLVRGAASLPHRDTHPSLTPNSSSLTHLPDSPSHEPQPPCSLKVLSDPTETTNLVHSPSLPPDLLVTMANKLKSFAVYSPLYMTPEELSCYDCSGNRLLVKVKVEVRR